MDRDRRRGPADDPRLLGKPGVGKTTLAYAAGQAIEREVYIFQATMDTRPEDLLITPVVDRQGAIRYVASPSGHGDDPRRAWRSWTRATGCPRSPGPRWPRCSTTGATSNRSWPGSRSRPTATSARGHDERRRLDLTSCRSTSTRGLQPQIHIDFPDHDEEKRILSANLPFADDEILDYVTRFLQSATPRTNGTPRGTA